jgi:hypothetical protein
MKHTVTIEAMNGGEALALKTALADPATRSFVLVVGSLLVLVNDGTLAGPLGPEARERALQYVAERELATKD